jgi:hypothetical protein
MKNFRFNFLTFAAVIIGALFFITCCDEDEPDSLSVSKSEFTFEADDTESPSVEITTSAATWHARSTDESWLGYSSSGNRLSISVEKYTSTEGPRNAEIIIEAGTAEPVSISVTQNARHSLSISEESLAFEPDGSTGEVTVTTSAPSWEATKETDADWFSFSKQGDKLTVAVVKNTNTDDRTGTIKITAGNATEKTLTVTQGKSHTLSVDEASLSFEANGIGEKSVTITTTAPSWDATPSAQWVQVEKQGNTLKVKVTSENGETSPRNATIKITAGTAPERTINVTQKEHTLSVSPMSLTFTASETGARSITVTTTASSWNMTTNDSWIQLTKQGNVISVTVSSNSSTSSRSGTIKVTAASLERTVTVIQNGKEPDPYISVSSASLNFGASSPSAQTVTVTTNVSSWNATTTASWLTLTQQSNTLRVSATTNTSSARSATIRFTAGTASVTVSVTQDGSNPWPFETSTFRATGTPLTSGDPTSWTGLIVQVINGSFYGISQWGKLEVPVYVDYISGKLILDSSTSVASDGTNDFYFRAMAVNVAQGAAERVPGNYEVKYNASTRTLDFSGTYGGNPVYVGYVTNLLPSNQYGTIALYRNAQLVLTSTSSAPVSGSNNASKSNLNSNGNLLRIDKMVTLKKMSSVEDSK